MKAMIILGLFVITFFQLTYLNGENELLWALCALLCNAI